ncbi:4'-phosphopantetheinyl transferase B [Penicillium cataractarum]|uniref:4'-phosphopantetheinyl transferase B n=1 Tax=Penicillium cataractarum TaxID=2100454 RepID=A0A9X0B662_9EURO|nr:4'-phosphopantetheinyl transferase B [Penicillium cataractarum]KAJ5389467.1 4'-phosphopantetheinyl transferase B [Penicillium cataractarum]
MKPLPFPLALNIGTDIVHLPRITRLLQRPNYLTRFTRRILSEHEQLDFQTRFKDTLPPHLHPSSPQTPTRAQTQTIVTPDMTRWLAGRFAAKEAARKAAPDGAASLGWKDVEVRVPRDNHHQGEGRKEGDRSGVGGGFVQQEGTSRRPEIVFLGGGEGRPDRLGRLSISHDGEYVVATVLAAG